MGGRGGIFDFECLILDWGPYFVPHVRDFEGRPLRAGMVSRLGGIRLGLALPNER